MGIFEDTLLVLHLPFFLESSVGHVQGCQQTLSCRVWSNKGVLLDSFSCWAPRADARDGEQAVEIQSIDSISLVIQITLPY
jgi:hypothetical protein